MLPFLRNKKQKAGAAIVTEVKASDFDKKKDKKSTKESKPKKSKEKVKVDHKKLFSVEGASDMVSKIQVKLNLPKNIK